MAVERRKADHDHDVMLTWLGEALARTKRLPALAKLLGTKAKAPTPAEFAAARAAHASIIERLGGPDSADGAVTEFAEATAPPTGPEAQDSPASAATGEISDEEGA